MSPAALALLLTAAVLHAGWNLLVKRAGERFAFTGWALLVSSVVALPALVLGPPLPWRVWPYAVASAAAEVGYFVTLVAAYGRGDFSLVYPVARGAAPAFLALWAFLFLGERPRPLGLAGIGLVIAGLVVLGRGRSAPGASVRPAGLGLALAVALCISLYSAIDGAAVRFAPVLPYTALVFVLTALFLAPILLRRYGLPRLLAEWRANRLAIGAVGLASLGSYALVLAAFAIAPVAYAGAVREVSVVLAALAGWWLLGEGFGPRRTVGAILVLAGIVVLATAGR